MDSEDSLADTSVVNPLEKPNSAIELRSAGFMEPTSDCVTFIKRSAHYVPAKQSKLKNSLLAGVGFLELANAGDFAANVWNQVPVPPYAGALMGVGGATALFLSSFAFADVKLSWRNLCILRKERHELRRQKTRSLEDRHTVRDLDTRLDVNLREIGMEFFNRVCMNTLLGCGAVLIGIGTLMAIGGADERVWQASNLLSGYIGNVPLAVYAVVNAVWCCYVWKKAREHGLAAAKALNGIQAGIRLQRRVRNLQIYTVIYGVTGILGGVGSLLVSTRWWGYILLIPVILSSIFCNYIWRRRLGYDRPFFQHMPRMDQGSLVERLDFVVSLQHRLRDTSLDPLDGLVSESKIIESVMGFIVTNDLFEDFCTLLLCDAELSTAIVGHTNQTVTISLEDLLKADPLFVTRLLGLAQTCVNETGPTHFQYQERYLLDTLGCYLCTAEATTADIRLDSI